MATSLINPKSLASLADRLYKIKALKAELAAKVKVLDDERIELEARLINELPKDSSTGVQGKLARVSLIIKEVPQAEDWDKIRAYIRKTGDWEILTKSLKSSHIQDIWDDGKKVPGIVAFDKVTVSLNKI